VDDGRGGELTIEVTRRALVIRPKGAVRGGPAEFTRLFSQIYLDAAVGGPLAPPRRRKGRR
jgi:hypothetical protein